MPFPLYPCTWINIPKEWTSMVCGLGAGGLGRKKEGRSPYKVHVHLGEFRAAKRASLQPSSGLRMHNTPCFRRNSVAGKLLERRFAVAAGVSAVVAVVAVVATVTVTVTSHCHCHSHFCHYSCSSSVVDPQVTLMPLILVTPRVPNCQLITLPPRKLLLLF